MLVLVLTPAELWKSPTDDAVYKGFDPNLTFVSAASGSINISSDSIDVSAPPGAHPTILLATTLLPRLDVSLDVLILQNSADEPLRIGIWSPWTRTGRFLVFGPAPQDLITTEDVTNGRAASTLIGGALSDLSTLGHYQPGITYHVSLMIDKRNGTVSMYVSSVDGRSGEALSSSQSPATFGNVQVSVTASALAGQGNSRAVLRNYRLTLPHQRAWANRVLDLRTTLLMVALAVVGFIACLAAIVTSRPLGWVRRSRPRDCIRRLARIVTRRREAVVVVVVVGFYLIGNTLLFQLGGHPVDFGNEKLYAYVARSYGPSQLYYLPNAVSLAGIWSGVPYIEAAFPYGPTVAYLFDGIGWMSSLSSPGGGAFTVDNANLGFLIKAINVLFGLADSALVYLILGRLGTSERWRLIGSGLFLFNPAVWFSMSVWGQTHVISLFFALLAILLAERRLLMWAWLALAAGCMTRPQMLAIALILGVALFQKFSWRENGLALSWTMIVTFIALLPLTAVTSPSLPVDVILHAFSSQQNGGNAAALNTVSQDAYSVWPLVTYFVQGTVSLHRAFTPSSDTLVGWLTYQRLSQISVVSAMLVVCGTLLFRKRAPDEPGAYIPFVALATVSFLMLVTGVVATHFLLALPFLILSQRWMGRVPYFYILGIWTITTFVPMYGDMGNFIRGMDYPMLSPSHNVLTRLVVNLYASDRFITFGVVGNVCAAVWLAVLTIRGAGRPAPSREVPT